MAGLYWYTTSSSVETFIFHRFLNLSLLAEVLCLMFAMIKVLKRRWGKWKEMYLNSLWSSLCCLKICDFGSITFNTICHLRKLYYRNACGKMVGFVSFLYLHKEVSKKNLNGSSANLKHLSYVLNIWTIPWVSCLFTYLLEELDLWGVGTGLVRFCLCYSTAERHCISSVSLTRLIKFKPFRRWLLNFCAA